MKPIDINKLIASQVLGYEVKDDNIVKEGRCRTGIPSYSQKIEHAWQVVEKMRKDYDFWFELTTPESFSLKTKCYFQLDDIEVSAVCETASMAICKAALLAIEAKNKNLTK
ncbi:hypothetical protein P4K49_29695 [Bacillus cereus]|uniref:BC1872 family protein n=1 Tax=Bacillati TaxID=1783272 RepID=UPI0006801859|nr:MULTISPECIES: hypothetical protein [Bacillaceae]MEB8879363.1 hypothetical protein [Bacillus cereus]MBG9642291.1 hypothetical protein [Bacillus thuringiensis]MBG9642350.1 hypothetical protein [Bacillus thuringiensis]MBG9649126.1 hypothetical protein [Bacillus thuringiensis]MBG9649185.1 hypothetical protein [Bacillus thuringiensis]